MMELWHGVRGNMNIYCEEVANNEHVWIMNMIASVYINTLVYTERI